MRKILRHRFFDRHTVPGMFVLLVLGFFVSQFLGGILPGILGFILFPGNAAAVSAAVNWGGAAGSFAALSLFWRLFYPEYEGGLRSSEPQGRWILFSLAASVVMLLNAFLTDRNWHFGILSAVNLSAAVMAGISEEAVCRGMAASYLMRQWRGENKILPAIMLSSSVFGAAHLANLFAGAPVLYTVIQSVYAFALGCLLCALFFRSGSLIPSMILHTLTDMIAFMNTVDIKEGGVIRSTVEPTSLDILTALALSLLCIGVTLYLTRPAVRGEIVRIWERKWRKLPEEIQEKEHCTA